MRGELSVTKALNETTMKSRKKVSFGLMTTCVVLGNKLSKRFHDHRIKAFVMSKVSTTSSFPLRREHRM